MSTRKKIAFATAATLMSLLCTGALAELVLRAAGHQPWVNAHDGLNEPAVTVPHDELGWVNRVGSYVIPPYSPEGKPVRVTILSPGIRRVREGESSARKKLILVGGSFTYGLAVSDEQTFAWKLQERFPDWDFINYSASGYGTYQALLTMERELPKIRGPKHVVYGFLFHHEVRNVATGEWLAAVRETRNGRNVPIPYVSMDEATEELERHPPQAHLMLPFREQSALVALAERAYMTRKTAGRSEGKRDVTFRLLQEMQRVATANDAQFTVALLFVPGPMKQQYLNFMRRQGIEHADCVRQMTPAYQVPGELHPNGRLHSIWADCLERRLRATLDGQN